MHYNFEWDLVKENKNIRKHNVTFRRATAVFRDPNQVSVYDEEHSTENEDRWITIGIDNSGMLWIVSHTFEQINKKSYEIRIISARKATNTEINQYKEGIIL
ncbi:MAG: BrnT family toxin [Chloroflexi bacterium]|nr:BrnT family toxin [Chloroflexota bacterium]